jgi:hypothetical protein
MKKPCNLRTHLSSGKKRILLEFACLYYNGRHGQFSSIMIQEIATAKGNKRKSSCWCSAAAVRVGEELIPNTLTCGLAVNFFLQVRGKLIYPITLS